MSNDSSTGGLLAPAASPAPQEGQTLNRFLQQVVAGIVGIDPTLVRPRWQPDPPTIPAAATAWIALGIRVVRADTFAYVGHDPAVNGADQLQRHEEFELDCSFYDLGSGAQAGDLAARLRDGLSIAQNRETFAANEIGLIGCGDQVSLPTLLKERWLYRVDMPVSFRRRVLRTYPVLNLLHLQGTLLSGGSTLQTTPLQA